MERSEKETAWGREGAGVRSGRYTLSNHIAAEGGSVIRYGPAFALQSQAERTASCIHTGLCLNPRP
jgi:hypothetical protein